MRLLFAALCLCIAYIGVGYALTDAEAQQLFRDAQKNIHVQEMPLEKPADMPAQASLAPDKFAVNEADVLMLSPVANAFYAGNENAVDHQSLADIGLAIDVENTSLETVINNIVADAAVKTGPWSVKWRLKPENEFIKAQKVNLVAEVSFDSFVNLLSERIKNMTGVQLFVTVFNGARVIIISDTYA